MANSLCKFGISLLFDSSINFCPNATLSFIADVCSVIFNSTSLSSFAFDNSFTRSTDSFFIFSSIEADAVSCVDNSFTLSPPTIFIAESISPELRFSDICLVISLIWFWVGSNPSPIDF